MRNYVITQRALDSNVAKVATTNIALEYSSRLPTIYIDGEPTIQFGCDGAIHVLTDAVVVQKDKPEPETDETPEGMTLAEMVRKAFDNAKAKGFYEEPMPFPEAIAQVHAELVEVMGAFRFKGSLKHTEYDSDDTPQGVPTELADVMILVASICGHYGIDLETAIAEKMAYNETRPYLHGKEE